MYIYTHLSLYIYMYIYIYIYIYTCNIYIYICIYGKHNCRNGVLAKTAEPKAGNGKEQAYGQFST